MCITIPPWHYSSHNYREARTNERCPCIKWGSLPKKFCWKFNSSDLSNVEAVRFVWELARKQTNQFAYLRMLTYFWILPILGSDFGTPVALSATKPIPVFQYLFVALCATYWSAIEICYLSSKAVTQDLSHHKSYSFPRRFVGGQISFKIGCRKRSRALCRSTHICKLKEALFFWSELSKLKSCKLKNQCKLKTFSSGDWDVATTFYIF